MASQQASATVSGDQPPKVAFWNDPVKRGYVYQFVLFSAVVFLFYEAATNAIENLTKQKIASGFGFWNNTAGFDIGQRLISYSNLSSYGRAFWVGLLNTLLVASIGIVLATILGFIVGIARLSKNWLVRKIAAIYVELIRNTPLLLQLLFWYNAVLKALPEVRNSTAMPSAPSSTIVACSCRSLFRVTSSIMSSSFSRWAASATGCLAAGQRSARMRPASRPVFCRWRSAFS